MSLHLQFSLRLPLPFWLSLPLLFPTASAFTEIYDLPSYSTARNCIQNCAFSASLFGVSSFPCYQDFPATCLCNRLVGQSSKISSFASACAFTNCINPIDVTKAENIWADYCRVNDAVLPAVTKTSSNLATVAGTPSPSKAATVTTAAETSAPTTTDDARASTATAPSSSSSLPNPNSSALPLWVLISIAAAVPIAVSLLIGLGLWCFFRRRTQHRRATKSMISTPILHPSNNSSNSPTFPPSTVLGPSAPPYSPADFWKEDGSTSSYMLKPMTPVSGFHSSNMSQVGLVHGVTNANANAAPYANGQSHGHVEWPLSPAVSQFGNGHQNYPPPQYQQQQQQYFELPGSGRAELE